MRPRLAIFALVCLAQLVWAGSALWSGEARLQEGREWRFQTRPVDPADLLRGRYVRLGFEQTSGPAEGQPFQPGETGYVRLAEDARGFATVTGVAHEPPGGDAYLAVRVLRQPGDRVVFEFPIDRLYMPEELAPVAEQLYRRGAGRAWAVVRVHEGRATLIDVLLDGVPLAKAARERLPR